MDTFMDKLAQKLTAQEIIKANAAADAEELNRLQNQVKEYNECLAQMRQVNQKMQETAERMEHLMEEVAPKMDQLSEEAVKKMEAMQGDGERVSRLAEESMEKLSQMQQDREALEDLQKSLTGLFAQSDDFVHKENVKVYRNVQAVVMEESGKQKEVMENHMKALSGRLNVVLGVACAALAAGVLGLAFQLLTYFHVF